TFGGPLGPKSRGGVVTVLGGAAGPLGAWAATRRGARATAPAAAPTVLLSPRLDIRLASCRSHASRAMTGLLVRSAPRPAGPQPRDGLRRAPRQKTIRTELDARFSDATVSDARHDRQPRDCAARTWRQRRSRVSGISVTSTPSGRRASATAFAIAAGAGKVPPSPAPLTPSGLSGEGVTTWCTSRRGTSVARGSA